MRRMKLTLSLFLLLALASTSFAQGGDDAFLGKWDITATSPNGTYPYWLEVKKEAGALVGYFLNRGGSVTKLPEIAIENGELVFSVGAGNAPKQTHRAKVQGGKLIGSVTVNNQTIPWVGVRPPKWGNYNANAKHKFRKPVELFNGKDLSNWDLQIPNRPSGWTVVDGTMTNEAKANNLVSKEKFKDFKLRAEYKVEPKSNSGIYLRGRYELQVLDDHGKEPDSHGHMGLYSRVKPLLNASRPAGEWQEMEATIVGNRLTVVLNGKTVHDNIVIEGITGGAIDSDEADDGPIMLQGDHGKVWFRKVTVTPIVE